VHDPLSNNVRALTVRAAARIRRTRFSAALGVAIKKEAASLTWLETKGK